MFSLPQPPAEGDAACPVVHLSDTAADVTAVLEALFLLKGLPVAGGPLDLAVLAAFLRLGRKYEIDWLHADALRRLRFAYPSTLEEYDEHGRLPLMIKWEYYEAVAVANLARKQIKVLETGVLGRSDALSADNIPACLAGWSALGEAQYTTTLAWLDSPDSTYPNCTSPVLCTSIRQETLRTIFFPRVHFVGEFDWDQLNQFRYDYGIVDDMCSSCNSVAEELHNVGRAKFWEKLPGIFDLPDWAELRKE